ncbi:phosphate/phosphite/phosphonate ABC transporter substrate-binding protein [bacterium]|nr:phosphate/phosphite/phosphonate ABC transporter substrate-binding protein [bacterium]
MKAKYFSVWLVLVLMTLLSAACVAPAPAGAPASEAAPTAAESADAGESDERADWPEVFRLGLFGGDDAEQVLENNQPFADYMAERLGVEVDMFTGTSYTAVIEAMRADRVDAMQVGPFAYVLAVQEAGAEALGAGISTRAEPAVFDPTLPAHYYSIIFTKKGSGIETIEDLRGQDFNFVDPASTSGHLAPKTLLFQMGINPDEEMQTVFAGSHPTAVISVWNDKAPAGATHESNLYRLRDEGQIDFCGFEDNQTGKERSEVELRALYESCPEGHIVMLAMTDPIPNTPFAIRSNMPASFKAAVKEALLDIQNNPEMIEATARWYVDPSAELGLETLDQYYNSLRDIAGLLDLDLQELANQ